MTAKRRLHSSRTPLTQEQLDRHQAELKRILVRQMRRELAELVRRYGELPELGEALEEIIRAHPRGPRQGFAELITDRGDSSSNRRPGRFELIQRDERP